MKLEEKYSIKDLDTAVKYALNKTITVQATIDIKDLKKIESMIDKELIQITEDNKSVVIETNRKDIKSIQEQLNKNNIKYNSFACLEDKKVEYLPKDNTSLYVAASMLLVANHHKEYYGLDSKNVMDKGIVKTLEEFKNENLIEKPNNINKELELPSKSKKEILTGEDLIEKITRAGMSSKEIVETVLNFVNERNKKQENKVNNSLKPKPTFNKD